LAEEIINDLTNQYTPSDAIKGLGIVV
jgi:hypothetical protein